MKKMIEDIDTANWYSREEVARELVVSLGTVDRITMLKMFTMTRSPRSKRVYFLKSEVDHMVGYDDAPITSRRAYEHVAEFRMQQRLSSPIARQEASSGAPFVMTPEQPHQESESMRAFRMFQDSLLKAYELTFGNTGHGR